MSKIGRRLIVLALAGALPVAHVAWAGEGGGEGTGLRQPGRVMGAATLLAANSLDDLFDEAKQAPAAADKPGSGLKGHLQLELARTYASPSHWSKAKARLEAGGQGRLTDRIKWKATGRLDYDAVFDIEKNFYPGAVRHDQRQEFSLRETYLDISAGEWDFRLGRQHVVWGEMVGLFFADVVSAKDLREFILPDFDALRIPQWAARAEYFKDDLHGELLWIPYPSYDKRGKPCAEFFGFPPAPQGAPAIDPCAGRQLTPLLNFTGEDTPARKLSNSNFGLRGSLLREGWDVSLFYYRSFDASPAYYRSFAGPVTTYVPRHERISQFGGTLAKDFGSVVLKAEVVATNGRKYTSTLPTQADGLVRQDTLDYALGLDFSLPRDARLNVQLFQRIFHDHDPNIIPERQESGFTVLLSGSPAHNLDAQALLIRSLNRPDWLFRPKLTWSFEQNWRWVLGADVFGGPPTGLFGQFANRDRVFSEVRRSF